MDEEQEAVRNINKSAIRNSKNKSITDNRRFESPSIRNSEINHGRIDDDGGSGRYQSPTKANHEA